MSASDLDQDLDHSDDELEDEEAEETLEDLIANLAQELRRVGREVFKVNRAVDRNQELFEDALKESMESQVEKIKKSIGISEEDPTQGYHGLDALIRSTIGSASMEVSYTPTKRITFIFENNKLEKLKTIAKKEKAYIKDIINGIISSYIQEYEDKKGKLN